MKNESLREEKIQSASVESIPEVLEECTSVAEHSDSASVHDMDYVNPRGVRFTQSSQKEGESWAMFLDFSFFHCSFSLSAEKVISSFLLLVGL